MQWISMYLNIRKQMYFINMPPCAENPFIWLAVVQSLSRIQLFATPWPAACQSSLSLTFSQILPKFMSIESVMPSKHLILCYPLLLLPSIFPNIRVFSSEPAVCIRWPKDWSFRFSTSPSNEYSGFTSLNYQIVFFLTHISYSGRLHFTLSS